MALESGTRLIACEISITTTVENELGNVRKCLAADFNPAILLTSETKHLRKLQSYIEPMLLEGEKPQLRFFLPDQFITYLDEEQAFSAGSESTIKGYKVKTWYRAIGQEEQKSRRVEIAKVIIHSTKRMEKT